MKKIIIISCFLTALIIAVGCCLSGKRNVYYDFDSTEMSWQIYNLNDSLIFENQFGEREYFFISKIAKDTAPSFEKFTSGCEIRHRTLMDVYFAKVGRNEPDWSRNVLEMEKSNSGLYMTIYWESLKGYDISNNYFDSIEVKGTKYYDVHKGFIDTNQYKFDTWRWFYSKQKGMLRYETLDGKVFDRIN